MSLELILVSKHEAEGVFLHPHGWDASLLQGYPQH